jgi:hypothetical protein
MNILDMLLKKLPCTSLEDKINERKRKERVEDDSIDDQ